MIHSRARLSAVPIPTPVTASGVDGLAAILAEPARAVLAFDYDGVLAPIVADPDRSPPHPRAVPTLARLAPHVRSIAVITGRPAAVAVGYGRFGEWPDLADLIVFGHYGRERWDGRSGRVSAPPPSPAIGTARRDLPALLERVGVAGAWIEDKGSALAVHTRRSPEPERALEAVRGPLAEFAMEHDLIVEPGRLVLELRPPGTDKGGTLSSYVESVGARAVAYVGDDLGDLTAFAAIDRLRREGVAGLKVCSGSAEVAEVARQADLVVDGPDGLMDLLDALAEAFEAG